MATQQPVESSLVITCAFTLARMLVPVAMVPPLPQHGAAAFDEIWVVCEEAVFIGPPPQPPLGTLPLWLAAVAVLFMVVEQLAGEVEEESEGGKGGGGVRITATSPRLDMAAALDTFF